MELVNQMLVQYPQLLYGGVGVAACLTGGALVCKITNRYHRVTRARCFTRSGPVYELETFKHFSISPQVIVFSLC